MQVICGSDEREDLRTNYTLSTSGKATGKLKAEKFSDTGERSADKRAP